MSVKNATFSLHAILNADAERVTNDFEAVFGIKTKMMVLSDG